jgi:hypothetical protein
MKREQPFLRAAQTVAPDPEFAPVAARLTSEESRPASLEEATEAMQKLMLPASHDSCLEPHRRERHLSLGHALRIQSAHYWLELGEVEQALRELGALSTNAFNHPTAVKARVAVLRAVRKRNEVTGK